MGIKKQYKNIVWDWNGTLLDDFEVSVETINNVLTAHNLNPITADHYREIFGFPVKTYYERIGFNFSTHCWETVSVDFIATYRRLATHLKLTSGVRQTLRYLKEKGYNLYILSALKEDVLHEMLVQYNIQDYFTAIYGAADIYASGKIARGKELVLQNQLNVGQTVMIGDTLHDAEVAKELGFDVLLYSGGHNSRQRLQKIAPVIDRMEELIHRFQ